MRCRHSLSHYSMSPTGSSTGVMSYSSKSFTEVDHHLLTFNPPPPGGHSTFDLDEVWLQFENNYCRAEITWSVVLVIAIALLNGGVIWVVYNCRQLWKPRHLWMACLCATNLGVGAHKVLELVVVIWPQFSLCVVQRSTFAVPYVVNMLLLTCLSLDRFLAVAYPYFYSAKINNRQVFVGYLIVVMTGTVLGSASLALGLREDTLCRPQALQLLYLTVVLTVCSFLILYFNSVVLRIASKQLHAIYNTRPQRLDISHPPVEQMVAELSAKIEAEKNLDEPSNEPRLSLLMNMRNHETVLYNLIPEPDQLVAATTTANGDLEFTLVSSNNNYAKDDLMYHSPSRGRTASLPAEIPMNLALLIPADPMVPVTAVRNIAGSTLNLMDNQTIKIGVSDAEAKGQAPMPAITLGLPRSRTFTCINKVGDPVTPMKKYRLFKKFHFGRSHVFHAAGLFPSIRFARTVLMIMIPMWIFILPVITIIPMHHQCMASGMDCRFVNSLWSYLLVHLRSILPVQAILDTLIYVIGAKEFRRAIRALYKWGPQKTRCRVFRSRPGYSHSPV